MERTLFHLRLITTITDDEGRLFTAAEVLYSE
jgi:hypothetical protein